MHQNSYTILEATDAQANQIIPLLEQCNLTTTNVLALGSRFWFVEDKSKHIIAVAGLEFGSSAVLLRSVAVNPAFQGQGIATMLVEFVLNWAKAHKYAVVYLFSTEAGAYWTRFGFCEVPVHELADTLPQAPQVVRLRRIGRLDSDMAWCKHL